jgi:hypothetical protein
MDWVGSWGSISFLRHNQTSPLPPWPTLAALDQRAYSAPQHPPRWEQPRMLDVNRCFMRFSDRAERIDTKQIAETFVSVGPLLDVLASRNNQLVYGRRGTGKTHALRYFLSDRNAAGDVAVYVDCQNIGSNQSIYDDKSLPLTERATRLLIDVCSAVHAELLDTFTDPIKDWDTSQVAPLLDDFVSAVSQVRVNGLVESETARKSSRTSEDSQNIGAAFGGQASLNAALSAKSSETASFDDRTKRQGAEIAWIDFNYLNQRVRALSEFISPKRIWVLIDEWSTVPLDLQPYLADLLRRTFFTAENVSVKIAAIEHRSLFKVDREDASYIGFELGADISPAINLDDYLVFDNNEQRSVHFFRRLITNHVSFVSKEIGINLLVGSDTLVNTAFTQQNVFLEFVRASEGVPRDAMHILALAAQRANDSAISMPVLRNSALIFFQTDKYSAIQSNQHNRKLLDWIRDEVIGNRRTRAFLLPVGTEDATIDRLFDRRALHIKSRSMSSAHRPGERFVVYKLDYGCYADLVNTDKAPAGMLLRDEPEIDVDFEVPDDDARSYRRAVLDLSRFYRSEGAIS